MRKFSAIVLTACSVTGICSSAFSQVSSAPATPVTIDNYNRAQSDFYFSLIVRGGGFGKFIHARDLAPIGQRGIIRPNRDTLYSIAVFDLKAGPVTISLPDPGRRFMAMQIVNEDQYSQATYYGAGRHTLTTEMIGTRYAAVVVRVLVDRRNKDELKQIHLLQDALAVTQPESGLPQFPNWDDVSRKKVQAALLQLGTTIADSRRMFGANENMVDPVRHVIGSAMLWGGNPESEALYLPTTPQKDDGTHTYTLIVKDVPVDGFWSITVYDSEGYFKENEYGAYSVNNITATRGADGSVAVKFGGCDGKIANCLPITAGWNYTVRLFRPRKEILDGTWKFPLAQPEN